MSTISASASVHDFQADIDLIASIPSIPKLLDVVCRITGLGFAAVARVTETRWVTCQVIDTIKLGLKIGDELEVESTICNEIRQHPVAVVINHVAEDPKFRDHHTPARYGFQSYISMPILLSDGSFYGTLCALDPKPAKLKDPKVIETFELFVELIAFQIEAKRRVWATHDIIRNESFIRSILKASPDCVKVLATDGTIEYINDRAVELDHVGSVDEVLGRNYVDLWPEQERSKIQAAIASAVAGETSRVESCCPAANGATRWWEVSFSRFQPDGSREVKLVGISRDITERAEAERGLAASASAVARVNADLEQQVSSRTVERDQIWQCSTDPLCVTSLDGYFLSVSPAWVATLGWSVEELKGKHFQDFVHPDDLAATQQAVAELSDGQPKLNFENRYRHLDGSYRWLSWNAVCRGTLIYATVRDMTASKQQTIDLLAAEDALRQAQKMEAIGQLTGGVAHDFNNLLTVISASCDLLKRPNLPEDRQVRHVAAISQAVDRAAKLIAQLLAFARRQSLRPELFAVCSSVNALSNIMETLLGTRMKLELDLPEEPCVISADQSQFDTALVNLAVNARDAMSGEGSLKVQVRTVDGVPAEPGHSFIAGRHVAVSISDTGAGVAKEHLSHIFEPFFTTKTVGQGTGLGLSQVFGFVKQSGGDIRVKSVVGKGTTFTLYLPAAPGAHQEHAAPRL